MSLWLEVLQEYEGHITAQRARAGDQRDHKTLICDQRKKERGKKKSFWQHGTVFSAVITTDIFYFIACRIDWFIVLRIQSQCLCDWLYSNKSRHVKKCLRNKEWKSYESLNHTLFLTFSVFDLVLKEIIIVLKLFVKLIIDCSFINL